MDELELLKKDWKKQDADYPKLTYDEIYKLIHKKSTSIVKWIFVICIAEFVFWGLLNLFIPESYLEIYEKLNLKAFLVITQVLHYAVIVIFIYFFYRNYRSISVIESTSLLMKKIINTRRTVNYYVYYNLTLYAVLSIIVNIILFSNPELLMNTINPENISIDKEYFLRFLIITQIISFFVVCGLLWLYYRIIYGILLKKLTKNYKELETLEF
jgi:hypothetical protein